MAGQRLKRKTIANTGFASGGVSCNFEVLEPAKAFASV
jgi:hypothetical protein